MISASSQSLVRLARRSPSSSTSISRNCSRLLFSTRPIAGGRDVVIVGGIRLPFAQASTIYQDEMAVDLQRLAIKGLIDQTALSKDVIDYVVCGNVIQEVRTSNIAREAAM